MKVLFLDIDGVLNSEAWYRARPSVPWTEAAEFDPEAMWVLKAIVAMTGCQIVICSSWRIGRTVEELQALFPGLPVIGKTPALNWSKTRGSEVLEYLNDHPEVKAHVILDDGGDFYSDQPLVRTSWKIGLRPSHAEQVVRILGAA